MRGNHHLQLLLYLSAALLISPLHAEDENEEAGERCINLTHIKEVDVLDNRRILFHMSGGKKYLNILPHRCLGLRKNQPFMYRTSLSQLCDLDVITVLDTGGFGLRPLGSCGLGRFMPVEDPAAIPLLDDLKVKD